MFEEAEQIIESYVQQFWTLTPLAFDNVNYRPETGKPFVRLQVDWVDGFSVGPDRWRNSGLIVAQCFTPVNFGVRASAQMADRFNLALQRLQIGHLRIFPARVLRIGENNGWYQRNVLVPFTLDTCKSEVLQ